MDPIDELSFHVALREEHLKSDFIGDASTASLDFCERRGAIEVRLPFPEQIQVGAIEYEDVNCKRYPNETSRLIQLDLAR